MEGMCICLVTILFGEVTSVVHSRRGSWTKRREDSCSLAFDKWLKTKDIIICLPNSLMIFLHFQASNSPVFNWWGAKQADVFLPITKPQVYTIKTSKPGLNILVCLSNRIWFKRAGCALTVLNQKVRNQLIINGTYKKFDQKRENIKALTDIKSLLKKITKYFTEIVVKIYMMGRSTSTNFSKTMVSLSQ